MGYNKIILHGGQTCDYLFIDSDVDATKFTSVDSEPSEWNDSTYVLSRFNGSLTAGEWDVDGNIVGYELRRRKGANAYTEHVVNLDKNSNQFIIDYLSANNTSYTYYLYPTSNNELFPPSVSRDLRTNWDFWTLLVVDESPDENVFYLSKMFKFELNLEPVSMNNNSSVTINQNFTRFPTLQHSTSNYWSGSLTALCGYISCSNQQYIETVDMVKELKELSSDTRRKFLKDISGNVWEVEISSNITIADQDSSGKIKSISLPWVEVGEVTGLSIVNNPKMSTIEWILTETGEPSSYIYYEWNDNYVWNDDKKWTEQNTFLSTKTSNLGRDIIETDGGDSNV